MELPVLRQRRPLCWCPFTRSSSVSYAYAILAHLYLQLLCKDGLARLPPITLKPEDEIIDDGKTPRAKTTFGRQSAEGEGEADGTEVASSTAKEPEAVPRQSHSSSGEQVVSPIIVLSPVDVSADRKTLPLSTVPDAPPVSPDLIPPRSASLRSPSPKLSSSSRTASPTPVSGDVILPLMIFAVVKANPPRLVSNLLYIQRFRRESAAGGEEGYCLINLMAVAEFLENVDLEALGLGDNENTVLRYVSLSSRPPSAEYACGAAAYRIVCRALAPCSTAPVCTRCLCSPR